MTQPQTIDPTFDLDLDTLSQQKKRVKIQGNIVEFSPPSLEDLIELAKLGGQVQKYQQGGLDANNVDDMSMLMDKLKDGLANVVPELKQYKLNMQQLLALIDLLVDSAQPADSKELQKRGIALDNDQKKTA
jgi:hypothetical protein